MIFLINVWKQMMVLLRENPIKKNFLYELNSPFAVVLCFLVPSMVAVAVFLSLTHVSPVWLKHGWLPRGMELRGLSSDHLQKQLNMSPVSVPLVLLGGWTWGRSCGSLAPWLTACLYNKDSSESGPIKGEWSHRNLGDFNQSDAFIYHAAIVLFVTTLYCLLEYFSQRDG